MNQNDKKIQRSNLNGSNIENIVTSGLNRPYGIAIDDVRGKIYWTDFGNKLIQRSNLDGMNIETVRSTDLETPLGIEIDAVGAKIYWVDRAKRTVNRVNLDGTNVATIISEIVGDPIGLALDLKAAKIYWTMYTKYGGNIQRANLNGTSVEILSLAIEPMGIALDIPRGKMYWINGGRVIGGQIFIDDAHIMQANLNGSNALEIVNKGSALKGLMKDIAVDTLGQKIYWTESVSSIWESGNEKIRRANLNGSNIEDLITDLGTNPTPIGIALLIGYQPPPIADFTGTPTSGTVPLIVQFTDQSVGTITSHLWDFGDGQTTTLQNPSHTYQNAGTYTVKLTVTGPKGSNTKTRTNYITVLPNAFITVSAPNGGEVWSVGTSQNITWTSGGTSGNVKIEYSANGGSSWSTIIASTSDDGSHAWTIPNTPSTNCLVKITDVDGSPSDQSKSAFTIRSEQVIVTAPNGGEVWNVGTSQNITWTSSSSSGSVKIEYSINGGSSWSTIVASTPDDGSNAWTIPNTPSTNCLVKITDTDGSPSDQSNSAFTIRTEQITVTAPNGGEVWNVGTSQNITWTSSGTSSNVNIEYSTNGGTSWTTIVSSTPNDGFHAWTIPNNPSTNCLVKITDTDGSPSDQSNSAFTISREQIAVTAPNGGEVWSVATSQNITWNSSGTSGNVKIEYSTNGGSSWSIILSSTPDDGSHAWTIPNIPSTNCLVKIADTDGSPSDQSNSAFSIQVGSITPGTQKWAFTTLNYGYENASPAIDTDGTIFVTHESRVYALDPNSKQKWVFETMGSLTSPAIGADGTIYVGSADKKIYAINPNGTLQWSFTTGDGVDSSPAIGFDGTIYVGSWDNNLYALNSNGTQEWAFTTGNHVQSSAAIGTDGTIYVGSNDRKFYALNPDGILKWSLTIGTHMGSSPAIGTDGTIYVVGSWNDKLYALSPDGTQKWAFNIGNASISSPAIDIDGTIYIGSNDNKLYAINPDGTQKWAFTTGSYVDSSPAIGTDGTVYVGSSDKKLYAINHDGTQKWSFTAEDVMTFSPTIGVDGTVYVGSVHKFYAIYTTSKGLAQSVWPKFRANNQNTGRFSGTGTSVQSESEIIPNEIVLSPNYPNPFNPETTIRFNLPKDCDVELSIYNMLGAKVRTLAKSRYAAGWYQVNWTGTDESDQQVSSGIYFLKLTAGEFTASIKMSLVR